MEGNRAASRCRGCVHPPIHPDESRSGEQPFVGQGREPGKGVAKENTSNAADLRGEGERGQDKGCVCARPYACVTLGQTCEPATCRQPAGRVSSKLDVYTPSRGAKRKIQMKKST